MGYYTGSDTVLILAVIDTGIDYLHPDLKNKIKLMKGKWVWMTMEMTKDLTALMMMAMDLLMIIWDGILLTGWDFLLTQQGVITWYGIMILYDNNGHGTYIAVQLLLKQIICMV
jgi:subtilisin family serine protease